MIAETCATTRPDEERFNKRPSGDPRHSVRATRTAGRQMRSRLLDAASRLFRRKGSPAFRSPTIAETADAFPSQITYYFRTKEALFVEAACRDVLYVGRAAEQHAGKALSPSDYTRTLVESVMGTDAVGFFVEAMTLTRRRQDLAPLVERTVERLHAEGAARLCRPRWRRAAGTRGSIPQPAPGVSGRSRSASRSRAIDGPLAR